MSYSALLFPTTQDTRTKLYSNHSLCFICFISSFILDESVASINESLSKLNTAVKIFTPLESPEHTKEKDWSCEQRAMYCIGPRSSEACSVGDPLQSPYRLGIVFFIKCFQKHCRKALPMHCNSALCRLHCTRARAPIHVFVVLKCGQSHNPKQCPRVPRQ